MTTIPTKDDGSLDLMRVCLSSGGILIDGRFVSLKDFYRMATVAALERCAEWHDKIRGQQNYYSGAIGDIGSVHSESAARIRQWIEKEKANG